MIDGNSKSYCLTYKGRRENNQDACAVITEGSLTLLAVADGMGGHTGGEIASRAVIEACRREVREAAEKNPSDADLKMILENIFTNCQNTIKSEISKNPHLQGMGTTLCCVLILGDTYAWGNIGDSRIYHFNGSVLKQISVDHSYVEEYRSKYGDNIPEYVKKQDNIITRSISGDNDQPDIFPQDKPFANLKWDEGFLLCSDGLIVDKTNSDSSWIMHKIINTASLKEAAENLIGDAFNMGSEDNISVVLYEHLDFERIYVPKISKIQGGSFSGLKPGQAQENTNKKFPKTRMVLVVSILLGLLLAGISVWYYLNANDYEIVFRKKTNGYEQKEDNGFETGKKNADSTPLFETKRDSVF